MEKDSAGPYLTPHAMQALDVAVTQGFERGFLKLHKV